MHIPWQILTCQLVYTPCIVWESLEGFGQLFDHFFFLRFKRGKDFKKRLLFALRSKEDLFLKQLLDTYLNRDVSNSSSDQTKLWSMILTVYSFLSFNLDLFGKKILQLWQGTNLPFCQCDYTHRLLWSPPWGWIIPHSTIFGGTGNIEKNKVLIVNPVAVDRLSQGSRFRHLLSKCFWWRSFSPGTSNRGAGECQLVWGVELKPYCFGCHSRGIWHLFILF